MTKLCDHYLPPYLPPSRVAARNRLSPITPVIAVHGNDETAAAQQELPYQQLIVVAGRRTLLTHAHYPDRAAELESRRDDAWGPKLARRAAFGRRAGASIVVFGHTHIPMAHRYDGMLLLCERYLTAPLSADKLAPAGSRQRPDS